MTATAGLGEYKKVQVGTSEGGKLILMLYEGAISRLEQAKEALRAGDMLGKGEHILRAQDILMELLMGLDPQAGEIAVNLQSLYLFMYRHLNDANLLKSQRHIDEVLQILRSLRDAWVEAVQKVSREGKQEAETEDAVAMFA